MASTTITFRTSVTDGEELLELHGRQAECARVAALVDGVRDGRSGALVIRGDPGLGKTALLEFAVAHATDRDIPVLRASGLQSESELAFAGLNQLLRPVLACAERLPGPQAAAVARAFGTAESGPTDPLLLALATLTLLSDAADPDGMLCVVDGAQWLDASSRRVLLAAARRLDAEGVVIVIAARQDEGVSLDLGGLPVLPLTPLSPETSAELLEQRFGPRLDSAARDRVLRAAAGNPLALRELAAATDRGAATSTAGTAPLPVGDEVELAFLSRVRELDEAAQRLLLVVAVDDSGRVRTVRRAAERLDIEETALDRIEAARLVTVEGTSIEFRHPLVRSAVYHSAISRDRARAHEAIADALDGERDEERRSWHRASAADGPDDAIACDLERAAQAAADRGAHAAAASALERAAELSEENTERGRRFLAAAEESRRAGRTEETFALLEHTRGLLDRTGEARAALTRGSCMVEQGALAEAFHVLTAAARNLPIDEDMDLSLALLLRAAEASWWTGREVWATEVEALASALPTSDRPLHRATVSLLAGSAQALRGDFGRSTVTLEGLFADPALAQDDPRTLIARAAAAYYRGDQQGALTGYGRAVEILRERGTIGELPYALALLASIELGVGRLPVAAANIEEGLELAHETRQDTDRAHLVSVQAIVEALRGDEEACRAHADTALRIAAERGLASAGANAMAALGTLELTLGRPEEAIPHLQTIAEPGHEMAHPMVALTTAPDLAEAAVRAGRPALAEEALARFMPWASGTRAPWALALASRMRALLSKEEAERHFDEAIALHGEAEDRFALARTRLLYGEHLRRDRRRVEAREHLRAALPVFDRDPRRATVGRAGGGRAPRQRSHAATRAGASDDRADSAGGPHRPSRDERGIEP